MQPDRQIVVAEGPLRRLEELRRLLAADAIPADVVRPPQGVGNG